jgi:predicted TIM-barrel fold metal-dependent hydrolase
MKRHTDVQGEVVAEKLTIVSSDSHAGMPKELWRTYLDPRFHDLLPALEHDNVIYPTAIYLISSSHGIEGLPEHQEAHRNGWHGLHDAVLRMADMDREGIAAELIYHGDSRLGDLFHNGTNRAYPLEAWEAGARAWNRWAADNFGFAMDRFLVTAAIGPCTDIQAAVDEIHWIADHGFAATYGPGYLTHPDLPPLYDPHWEPFFAACAERDIPMVAHAGFGTQQGAVFPVLEGIYDRAAAAAGSTDLDKLLEHADTVGEEALLFFNNFLNHSVDARRPLWQLMLGGAFDRHPNLKFMPTEIRLDWIPATLAYLDKAYDEHRDQLTATRKPSEYWPTNCLAGASFIHKAEVEMRHEIGIETIAFGRDYPHPEATWPHTREWLQDAFRAVPEDELRLMLGGNMIRFFNLDEARLKEISSRIGPTVEEVNGFQDEIRPELMENFALRGGYLKPAEGDSKLPLVEPVLKEDLDRLVNH